MKKALVLIAISSTWFAAHSSFAATVPAGTTLVVRTIDRISSKDRVGRTFTARLDQDVAVNGKVVLAAGTKVFGKIESSQADPRKSEPFILNLTGLSVNGRTLAIKTVGGFQQENKAKPRTARGARAGGVSVGTYLVQPGARMEFQLAQPVSL